MKKDVIIRINTETSEVISNSAVAGIKSENLQSNLIILPEPFIDGTGRFFIDEHGSIEMTKQENCYVIPILSSLLANGDFDYCFKITEPENEQGIPVFASEISSLKVPDTIESSEEIPEQYPTWIENYDSKIAEINELEQNIEQAEQLRDEAERQRNQAVQDAIETIHDLTDEYNENAREKTDDFNEDASNKKQELEELKEGIEDLTTAFQFPTFDVEGGRVCVIQIEKLRNTNFGVEEGRIYKEVHT